MQPQGPQNPYGAGPPSPYGPQAAPGQPAQPYQAGNMPAVPQPGQPYPGGTPYPGPSPVTPYTTPAGTAGKPGDAVIPPPPPRPESPYDFFMNPQKPKAQKKPLGLPGNKFVWIIGGGVALVGIITVVALSAPKQLPKATLVAVAQAQTETARLCTEGTKDAKRQLTKSFAYNCVMTQTTQSRQLVAQLAKSGSAPDGKVLGATRSAAADTKLKSAKTSSDYDDTFVTIIEAQLKKQTSAIKQAAASTEANPDERKLLTTYSQSTELLTKQLKPTE